MKPCYRETDGKNGVKIIIKGYTNDNGQFSGMKLIMFGDMRIIRYIKDNNLFLEQSFDVKDKFYRKQFNFYNNTIRRQFNNYKEIGTFNSRSNMNPLSHI